MVVGEFTQDVDVLVVGAGPAGLAAARRACALGKETVVVDPGPINSDVDFELLKGLVRFADKRSAQITGEHVSRIRFNRAIICTGCRKGPASLRGLEATRSWNDPSTGRVLIAGSGTNAVTTAMRSRDAGGEVVLACPSSSLLPAIDPVLAAAVVDTLGAAGVDLLPDVDFAGVTMQGETALVVLDEGTVLGEFDAVIPAEPDGAQVEGLDLETTRVTVDEDGWITTDNAGATGETRILAAGSVTGLVFEPGGSARHGHVVAEVACGLDSIWDPVAIPSFLELPIPVSWCGLNETRAEEAGHDAVTTGLGEEGAMVRIVHDRHTGLLLGAGACGPSARSVGEAAVLALEMGATIEDLAALTPILVDQPGLSEAARSAWKPTT